MIHTETIGKEEFIHVDIPAVVHHIHLSGGGRRGQSELLREHVDALSLMPAAISAVSFTNTLGTHLFVYGLQDPTHDRGLTQRGTNLVIPNLVTDHPEPRAIGIVHGDICPIRLTGIIRPETRPAHNIHHLINTPKYHLAYVK